MSIKAIFEAHIFDLQNRICKGLEHADTEGQFVEDQWQRDGVSSRVKEKRRARCEGAHFEERPSRNQFAEKAENPIKSSTPKRHQDALGDGKAQVCKTSQKGEGHRKPRSRVPQAGQNHSHIICVGAQRVRS